MPALPDIHADGVAVCINGRTVENAGARFMVMKLSTAALVRISLPVNVVQEAPEFSMVCGRGNTRSYVGQRRQVGVMAITFKALVIRITEHITSCCRRRYDVTYSRSWTRTLAKLSL